jgi:hypothetical protein
LVTAAALTACLAPSTPATFEVELLDVPINGFSSSPRLESGPGSLLLLSWLQVDDDASSLTFSRYANGKWSEPTAVAQSAHMFVNWADLPSVVPLSESHLAAHWMVSSGAHSHAYNIAFSESTDGGNSWSAPITPHQDNTDTEHGFVSIYSYDGAAELLWLDGRKMVNPVTDDPVASGMTLRSSDQLVDEFVCDCCQTDVAHASSGPVAVYRDRSVDEIRDIYVTRLIAGRWQTGIPVAQDRWEISGCPVNGPSIDADGDRIAVGWFTAASEPLVQVALSNDSGQSLSLPIEVVSENTLGRVAVALLDDGSVAVSWLENSPSGNSKVRVRRVQADGSVGTIREITDAASAFSVAQMQRHGSDLIFAWTQSNGDSQTVVSARVSINSL